MAQQMAAAVLYGREDLRLEQMSIPVPEPGELVLRVEAALTCGTDVKVYRRGYHAKMLTPPMPFGHEVAGVVSAAGAGVTAFREGDRVVALNSAPCGVCFWCAGGQENLCEDLLFNNGAYAEYIRVPARIVDRNVLPVPAGMLPEHAALTEPLACVVKGFDDTGAREGDTMAVIGAGPIGLMFLQVASLHGVRTIAVVKHAAQGEVARRFGAQAVVQLGEVDDVVAAVRALSDNGRGVDVAVDAVALPASWEQCIAMVRKGGVVNFFGGPPSGTVVGLDTNLLHYGDLTLRASFHHTPAICRKAFGLLESGQFPAAHAITGEARLAEVPDVFRRMVGGQAMAGTIKTVVRPSTGRAL